MEQYPSIGRVATNDHMVVFDKLDGSNIRAEWSRKTGFTKFGSRTRLLDVNEKPLGEAVTIFNQKYADALEQIFVKNKLMKATAFLEFHGVNSFAGFHEQEPHDLTLFDIHVYKQGMLTAREFLKLVGNKVDIPNIVFEGKVGESFIQRVRHSEQKNVTFEGVVCKGPLDNRNRPVMFKIKTHAWLDKLKNKYVDRPDLYEKLK